MLEDNAEYLSTTWYTGSRKKTTFKEIISIIDERVDIFSSKKT